MRSARVDSDCARTGGASERQMANGTTAQQSRKTREIFFKEGILQNARGLPNFRAVSTRSSASDAQVNGSKFIFSTRPPCFRVRAQSPAARRASWREVWGRVAQWDAAARAGAWRESWGSPFHFPRPRP